MKYFLLIFLTCSCTPRSPFFFWNDESFYGAKHSMCTEDPESDSTCFYRLVPVDAK